MIGSDVNVSQWMMNGGQEVGNQLFHADNRPDFAEMAAISLGREDERFEVDTATPATGRSAPDPADPSFPVEIRPPPPPSLLQSNGAKPPFFTWRCLRACGSAPVGASY